MIDRMIEETNKCLDNGLYISALTMALIIPDMCGKAEYPNEKSNKQRYITWFDEWIGKFETYEGQENPHLTGEIVYSLRCSMLHEGNPTIDKEKFKINKFALLWQSEKNSFMFGGSSSIYYSTDVNGNKCINEIEYEINIRNLVFKICKCAEVYYKENKDKFNYINYKIKNIDFLSEKEE